MKRSFRLMTGVAAFLAMALVWTSPARAGCLDNAGDFVLGALSGGATVAACEAKELVDSIKNLINTVGALANNVASNAKKVGMAAVSAVGSAAKDVSDAVGNAVHDLGNAVSQARTMASAAAMAPVATAHRPASNGGIIPRANLAAASPQQLRAALQRGLQVLTAMQSGIAQGAASRAEAAARHARVQALAHLGDAEKIVQTALLGPINTLMDLLHDLVKHPTDLLDPVATINKMVNDITKNVTSTMNHINDLITHDALVTLGGVEHDVQSAQSVAHEGDKLVGLMRHAQQSGSRAALQALNRELNAVGPRPNAVGQARVSMGIATASFRFAPVRSRLRAKLALSIAPTQSLASNLSASWAAIRARHPNLRVRPLAPAGMNTAKAQLDRMFLGKSPAAVARAKQDLLNRARRRYGSNPQLVAAIERNLDGYLRTHSLAGVRPPVMAARPHFVAPAPGATAPHGGIGAMRQ